MKEGQVIKIPIGKRATCGTQLGGLVATVKQVKKYSAIVVIKATGAEYEIITV